MTPSESHLKTELSRSDAVSLAEHKRVCMVTYSHYESDNRVMRYAETLAQRGDEVEVFALRRSPEIPRAELMNGVRVFRIQNRFAKDEKSRFSFLRPLLRFLAVSSWKILRRHRRRSYDLVHVHNIPDFMVFAAWYPKLTGARVILDIHDIVPELCASKFGAGGNSWVVSGMKVVEKLSAAFANHVIIANHLWYDRYTSRSAKKEKCSVFLNNVDTRIFHPLPTQAPTSRKQVILFPGGLQWHQGLDIAIKAFAKLRVRLPETEFHIYGDGIMKPELEALVESLSLGNSVRFFPPRGIHEIAEVMASADLGVVPKRADSFGDEAYSTKIMEFMAVGVPVVVANTRIDKYYFNDAVVRFFESGNEDALADAMYAVLSDPDLRCQMIRNAVDYVATHCWNSRKHEYLALVDALCTRRRAMHGNPSQPH